MNQKLCKDCRYRILVLTAYDKCTKEPTSDYLVSGNKLSLKNCSLVRQTTCGIKGKFWEEKQ